MRLTGGHDAAAMKTVGPQRLLVKLLEVEVLEVAPLVATPGRQQPRPHRYPGPGNKRGDQRRSGAVHPGDDERRRQASQGPWPSGERGLGAGGEAEGDDARVGRMKVGVVAKARIEEGHGGKRAGADRHPGVWLDDAAVATATEVAAEVDEGLRKVEPRIDPPDRFPRLGLHGQSPGIRGRRVAIPHRATE